MNEASSFYQSLCDMEKGEKDRLEIIEGIEFQAFLPDLRNFMITRMVDLTLTTPTHKKPDQITLMDRDIEGKWMIFTKSNKLFQAGAKMTIHIEKIR